ncbi:MAG: rod shape-determining protein [Oscillospiraceae bacterium]|nr:rod shape-determining protein [Oscillospiraceae bacterium]
MDIGIDLGTATVLIYVKEKGIVLEEPSVVAVNHRTEKILSVGSDAYNMIGKTPAYISAVRPLKEGIVCDYKVAEAMIQHFIRKVCDDKLVKPRIALCVPSGITDVESNAVMDVAIAAGARKVFLVEEPVAAAIGAGVDLSRANGNMIVDIGGGTTDIAVLSLNGIVNKKSVKVAGDVFSETIIRHVRSKHGVLIGERMADSLKKEIGSVDYEENKTATAKGRNLENGLPCAITISREELYEPLLKEAMQIVSAVKEVIERTPPELVGDLSENGIILTGGGALLHGMDSLLSRHTKIHSRVAENPVQCVAIGTGLSFDYMDTLLDGFMTPSMKKF